MKKDTRDIARGALTNFSGVLLGTLNILFYIFLSRVYGAEIVGIFVFSRSSVDIISKLGILGMDMGILSGVARFQVKQDDENVYRLIGQALTIGVSATVIITCLLEGALGPLAELFPENREYLLPLRIMGLAMVFWTISAILLFATRALRIMKYEVIVKNGIEPACVFLIAAVIYPFDFGITGLSFAFLVSVAVGTGVSCYFFSRVYSFKKLTGFFRISGTGKNLIRFSAPVGAYNTLDLLLQRIDLLILTRFADPASVGVYSMVQNTAFTFKKIRQSFDPIIVPIISAAQEVKDTGNLLTQYQNVTRWILKLNILFFGIAYFGADAIMSIFGSEFSSGTVPFIILTAAIMINTTLGISELFILIIRPAVNLWNTVLAIFAASLFSFLLIPGYGASGAALAMLASYTLLNFARLIEVYIMYSVHPFTRFHIRAAGAGFLAFTITLLLTEGVLGSAALSVITYLLLFLTFLCFSGLAQEEKQALVKVLEYVGFRKMKYRPGSVDTWR